MRLRLVVAAALAALLTLARPSELYHAEAAPDRSPTARFAISAPTILVDLDAEGYPSIGGFRPRSHNAWLKSMGLSFGEYRLPPEYVAWMIASGVQHVEVVLNGGGAFLYVNGQRLPYLAWDAEALDAAGDLAEAFELPRQALIVSAVPILSNLGVGLGLRFPLVSGEPIPFVSHSGERPVSTPPGEVIGAIRMEAAYQPDGKVQIAEVSEVSKALGVDFATLTLSPRRLGALTERGVRDLRVQSGPEGAWVWYNNRPLPRLVWDRASLQAAADVYTRLLPNFPANEFVARTLPALGGFQLDLRVRFPDYADVVRVGAAR